MSTRPISSAASAATKKLKKTVTHGELATILSRWAQSADSAWSVKLHALRMEIRADLMKEGYTLQEQAGDAAVARELETLAATGIPFDPREYVKLDPATTDLATLEALKEHTVYVVPTDSEGAE